MRLKVTRLRRVIKRDLRIEFGSEQLTSYGGLELLRRYFQVIRLTARIRECLRNSRMGSDYGCANLVVLVVGLLVVGARRLGQLRSGQRSAIGTPVRTGPCAQRPDRGQLAQAVHP